MSQTMQRSPGRMIMLSRRSGSCSVNIESVNIKGVIL